LVHLALIFIERILLASARQTIHTPAGPRDLLMRVMATPQSVLGSFGPW
jgi:hypothetical protein